MNGIAFGQSEPIIPALKMSPTYRTIRLNSDTSLSYILRKIADQGNPNTYEGSAITKPNPNDWP